MRRTIQGVRYDTETSICVGHMTGGSECVTDFDHFSEALYRAPRSGRWFLHGAGNARTRYAERRGQNETVGSEKIIPLDGNAAFAWAQENCEDEALQEYFGDRIENA